MYLAQVANGRATLRVNLRCLLESRNGIRIPLELVERVAPFVRVEAVLWQELFCLGKVPEALFLPAALGEELPE